MKTYSLDRIKAFIGDDQEMLIKLIKIFLENGPQILNSIQNNLINKDYQLLAFHAHKLKTSIDHFNIKAVTSEIRLIEDYAHNKSNLELLPSLIQKLEQELQVTMNELKIDFKTEL
ncbi:MAG: Hpt domain-containing protein [Bacteroidetes bacterium]|nr:Hpt domain-containing protein [Bacteroidota bacterium]